MGCHGGFSLPDATRREWYNPEKILQNVGLREGMVLADVGCGEGFFSILASKIVGKKGKIYAVDVDSSAVEKLKTKAKAENLTNIVAKAGKAEETVFCRGCVDVVFYSMDLHDFQDPVKVLANANEMVKPDGLVVDLDWKKIKMDFGPPLSIRFSEQYVQELLESQGLQVKEVIDVGAYHYVIVATPKRKRV